MSVERAGFFAHTARRHPLLMFFVLAFAITWTYNIGVIAIIRGGDGDGVWGFPGGFGPLIAAFITTFLADGQAGVRELLARMSRWRFSVIWYVVILIGLPLIIFAQAMIAGYLPSSSPVPLSELAMIYLGTFVVGGVFFGPLGEEPGWRGFALPRLQQHFGPLGAAVALGPIWACWHLPLFFTNWIGVRGGGFALDFGYYVIAVTALSVIMTWVFNHTSGSVLAAILFHAANNAASIVLLTLAPNVPRDPGGFVAFVAFALVLVVLTRGRLGYDPGKTELNVMLTDTSATSTRA